MNKKKSLLFCGLFFSLLLSIRAQISDSTTYERMLQKIVVRGNLYQIHSDVLIYNVSADSSLVGKTSFDALRNIPMLIVERNGSVRSVGDRTIEYLLNGLHDNSISDNIQDATESLDAKYLKQIEVRMEHNIDGTEKLQVNFVTKGWLVGYRGVTSSTLCDDNWRNGAYIFLKKGKWGLSMSYYNTWIWSHSSTEENEEYRYEQHDLNHILRNKQDDGYKVNLNNIEANLNYEISPRCVLSLFGRALLKANPHSHTYTTCSAWNDLANLTYNYTQTKDSKSQKDAEYEFTAGYEKLFGENAEHGKFYAGYEFYRRPVDINTNETYTSLVSVYPDYVGDFFNMTEEFNKMENWHTANVLYRHKKNGHEFFVEELARYRDESEYVDQKQYFDYVVVPYETQVWSDFAHRQFANMFQSGYGYKSSKMEFGVGGTYSYLYDYLRRSELQNTFSTNQQYLTPYVDISYVPTWKMNLRLSYIMGKQIPDVEALNPYVYSNVQGQITYGNPNLKPQTSHVLSLSSTMRVGKINLYAAVTNTFSNDLILQHSFLKDGLLNITKDNMGHRYEFKFENNASSKFTKTTWGRVEASLYYTDYAATSEYKRNHGFTFVTNVSLEQELPKNFDLSANAGYNTPWIYLQGKGSKNFYYSLRLEKSLPLQRIVIGAEAKSFIPIHYTNTNENRSEGYYSMTHDRSFHAAFSLSVRWRFGKLKADIRKVEEEIKHDDIKQNYEE